MEIERLSRSWIDACLRDALRHPPAVEVVESVDSTNSELMRRGAQKSLSRTVLLAEEQTAGRGRQGRRWISPTASNLYVSFGWCLPGSPAGLAALSLAVGVAVAEAVEAASQLRLTLKWPNDLFHADGKVGGVLVETSPARGGINLVVGVGINIAMPPEAGDAVDQPWVDLTSMAGRPVSRNALAAEIIGQVAGLLDAFPESGFAPWRDRWQSRDHLQGYVVSIEGPAGFSGVASGIAPDGGLQIATDGGLRVVHAGEARLAKKTRGTLS